MFSVVLLAVLVASPMTLPEIESEALANNPEIQSADHQARLAQSRLGTAASIDDPMFGYKSWGAPIFQPWNVNETQHMFMFTQTIPAKGKREFRYVVASDDVQIHKLLLEAKKREVVGMVRQAFYKLLRTYDELRIHHDQAELAEQTIEATRIQYKNGKATQREVLEAGLAYSRLAEHLIMFTRDADSARTSLNTLMGRPADQPLEVEGEYQILTTLPSQAELLRLAAQNRPELFALEAMQKQAGHKIELAQKGKGPDYTISAGYMLMPTGSLNRSGWLAEFSMSLPWLNPAKHDSEIRQAQEETAVSQSEYQKQQAAIAKEIREAAIRAEAAKKVVDLYREILQPDIQNVSRAATVAFQTNQAGLLGVLNSQGMSIDAEYALFDALSEYEQSIAELERAIGTPLPGERKTL